jgi:predicted transposase YbfD/YdcC
MEDVLVIFREVRDPRDYTARHDCASMLFVALMATLCGAKSCVDIADFCASNLTTLSEIVDLEHGSPSHDSFSRLFRLLDPEEMARAFSAFAQTLRAALGLKRAAGIVAVDGKRLRGAYERGRSHMPALMISVWDAETRLSLAARASSDGNETAATIEALKTLDLKGCTVTADALHCHPAMAQAITERRGHYALKLKGNNGPLHALAQEAHAAAEAAGKVDVCEVTEKGHGRVERRRASILAAPEAARRSLPKLQYLGRVESERTNGRGTSNTNVYYVALSKKMTAQRLMDINRNHWDVENGLHWPLDVVFHEDHARSRKDHAPHNLSFIRRMALDILKSHPDPRSPARKMNLAAWDKLFFFQLFTHMR